MNLLGSSIEALPNEVTMEIFHHLPYKKLNAIQRVCYLWAYLIKAENDARLKKLENSIKILQVEFAPKFYSIENHTDNTVKFSSETDRLGAQNLIKAHPHTSKFGEIEFEGDKTLIISNEYLGFFVSEKLYKINELSWIKIIDSSDNNDCSIFKKHNLLEDGACERLKGSPYQSYLFRTSRQPGFMTLSFQAGGNSACKYEDKIQHMRVKMNKDGSFNSENGTPYANLVTLLFYNVK